MGAYSVGKTSLVRRFVHEAFDERYTTTLGVKIETKTVELDNGPVKLVIWDMEGADNDDDESVLVTSRMKTYLKSVNGVILVADITRAVTVQTAQRLYDWLNRERPGIPGVILLNKSDLQNQSQAGIQEAGKISDSLQCFTTSALSGENVELTFRHLAQVLSEK